MIAFKCLDLQKRIGDIQRAVLHGPVVITAHGKPRDVLLSVEEFCRLKRAAGEAVPRELTARRAMTLLVAGDIFDDAASGISAPRQMASEARLGRGSGAVHARLAAAVPTRADE